MKKDPGVYLEDILGSIRKIKSYTRGMNLQDFAKDSKTQDAVVRNFEIIGEAARLVSPVIKKKFPEVPWKTMIGMRNKMIHEYPSVVWEVVWKTIQADIPGLEKQIEQILAQLNKAAKLF